MKPVVYRPPAKWRFIAALVAAAAVHLSALAFSPTHQPVALPTSDGLPDVELEPGDSEPQPEPQESALPTQQSEQPNEFSEIHEQTQRRPLQNRQPPIRAPRVGIVEKPTARLGKLFAINAPIPDYPYEARSHHVTGSGAVLLDVDPTTGSVIWATMIDSTGSAMLDNSAMSAFRRWRFKRGTPSPVKIPFTFTISGARL